MTGALIQAGASSAYVALDPTYSVIDIVLLGSTATASIKFLASGSITNQDNNSIGQWYNPPGGSPGAAYEIRATPNPDTPDSGTMNTWLALSSTRTWSTSTSSGQETKVFDIEIRPAGGSVIASTTVTLYAEATP